MNPTLSSFSILSMIGEHADVFSEIESEARKVAFDLLKKSLKIKKIDANHLQRLQRAMGEELFVQVLDLLNEKEVSALAKKADPHLTGLADMKAHQLRAHLRDVATSKVEPAAKPNNAKNTSSKSNSKKAPAKAFKPAVPLHPESMSAKGSRYRNAS